MRNSILSLLLLASTFAHAQQPTYSRVKVHVDDLGTGMHALGALGLAVDHAVMEDQAIVLELSADELDRTRTAGFTCDILIEDLSAYYRERNAKGPAPEEKDLGWICDGPRTFNTPSHFALGSMGGFFTWQEMRNILDDMVAAYPGLISARTSIGTTIEGRPLEFVRISNDPGTDQDKPEVMYNALHHAREPASLSQMIFFMWYLLENYGTDPEVTYLLDNRELYFLPCLNPDGYVYNEVQEPDGGGMWRKNRRDNGDGTFGVDLNRNYGWDWGLDDSGSSPDGNSDVYRGTGPFSEAETQAMRDFCNTHHFRSVLNYHTYHDLLIYPFDAVPNDLSPDSMLFEEHSRLVTRNNGYCHGTTNQVLFYLTNGGSDDWMYGEQVEKEKIIAMTPEVGNNDDGFWPPDWRIVPLCQRTMDMNLVQAHLVGTYARVIDRSAPVIDSDDDFIPFDIQRLGLDTGSFTVSIEPLENMISAGPPVTFTGMDTLETRTDSIEVFLVPGLSSGDPVRFILAVDNGGYTYRDTVTRVFGQTVIPLADNGNDLSNWDATSWGITTEDPYSPPSCITDSPFDDYEPWGSSELTLADPIDLTNSLTATLTFMCRWHVLRRQDEVQVRASTNDFATWTALCGIYTHSGFEAQDFEEPLYDGDQYEWVREEMSLNDYLGESVRLRFFLESTTEFARDGFYLDDLQVLTTTDEISGVTTHMDQTAVLSVQPNPSSGSTTIQYQLPSLPAGSRIVIYDAPGALVREVPVTSASGSVSIDTEDLGSGVYLYSVAADSLLAPLQRMLVLRP